MAKPLIDMLADPELQCGSTLLHASSHRPGISGGIEKRKKLDR